MLERADDPQRLGPRRAGDRDHVDERQLALGDRARLVEHDRVDPTGRFEHLRPFDQDAELRAAAGADEQRRRRCEAECARARDDQHGDGRREGERRVGARAEPVAERCGGDHDHDRHEDGRDPVCEPLHRRLAGLRVLDELRDLRERRVGADACRLDDEAPAHVDRRARDRVPLAHLDRQALAGQQGAVDRRRARDDDAVGGDLLAGTDDEPVTDVQIGDGHQSLAAVLVEARDVLRAELAERAQCRAGVALCAGLEVPAREQERDHDGRDLEVDLRAGAAA